MATGGRSCNGSSGNWAGTNAVGFDLGGSNGAHGFAVTGWIYLPNVSAAGAVIAFRNTTDSLFSFYVFFGSTSGQYGSGKNIEFLDGGGGASNPRTNSGLDFTSLQGAWHFFGYKRLDGIGQEWAKYLDTTKTVINASVNSFYTPVHAATVTGVFCTTTDGTSNNANNLNCQLADLAVWMSTSPGSGIPSDQNMTDLANEVIRPGGADHAPVLWLKMDEASGDLIDQQVPNNMTVHGTIGAVQGPFTAGGPGGPPGRVKTLSGGMYDLTGNTQG